MDDVIIAGAGPSGSIAALVLARAGARVRIVDRATFPRAKLCGDTVNPGTIAMLRRLGVAADVETHGLPVRGMSLSGPTGVVLEGRYPAGAEGRAIVRREFDWILLQAAIAAGVRFEPGLRVVRAEVDGRNVVGVQVSDNGQVRTLGAPVTIAADGRHSVIAFTLHLASHPPRPRRWAVGTYFDEVDGLTDLGEMHVRMRHYIGIAPVPGGAANVCIVKSFDSRRPAVGDPTRFIAQTIHSDTLLRDRFERASQVTKPVVLGPLAVDASATAIDGLLVTGDAAGFVDPMTGDGLHFAIRGGELAALSALEALEHGWDGVNDRYVAARRAAFRGKWRFNRGLRALVAAPRGIAGASVAAHVVPGVFRAIIRKAGDCGRS